ncbi:MAG: alpha/beta hydrolase [Granulosicoccus sp.]|nr:alpha/beta hydrolase [Granulosicoccus sp.]
MSVAWESAGELSVQGKTLEYACYGPEPAQAPTLILLHEGLGSTALWRSFPSELAQETGIGVFVYSRAGYGYSDLADLPRPLDYMTREAEDVLPELLDKINLSNGILVGHSDGASIAAIYAGSVADKRIKGVVLMAPHFFTEEMGLSAIAAARVEFDKGALRERMQKYHRDADNTFYGWNDSWLHPDFKQWNISAVLDQITVPVLAIQGSDDQYGTMAQIEVIKTRCHAPVESLILKNCRHSPFLEQKSSVLNAVSRFCEYVQGQIR